MSSSPVAAPSPSDPAARLDRLREVIEHACEFLPAQGPISVFIHHNTLHAFEHLPFDEGLRQGARLLGCRPYLPEDFYYENLTKGRIRHADLEAVLREDLGADAKLEIPPSGTRLELRLTMLRYLLRHGPAEELRWYVAETDALKQMRQELFLGERDRFIDATRHWVMRTRRGENGADVETGHTERSRRLLADLLQRHGEATIDEWSRETWEAVALEVLWRVCREGVHAAGPVTKTEAPLSLRHRDVLLEATGEDADLPVNEVLIRLCAAFTDQGFAPWPLPHREEGFFRAFCKLYGRRDPPDPWMRGLAAELQRLESADIGPLESILESYDLLGLHPIEWAEFTAATFLSLRGWCGLMRQMEVRGDRIPRPLPPETTLEVLAVRLILDRLSLRHLARETTAHDGELDELRADLLGRLEGRPAATIEERTFLVFQVAQVMGWDASVLHGLSHAQWSTLVREIESFNSLERRRILHHAYERRYWNQVLDAVSVHSPGRTDRLKTPQFQVMTCLDEREESFRRHLEETAPHLETFGIAGFYAAAMYYRGAAEAHFAPLCPVVIRPKHWVVEEVSFSLEEEHQKRARARRVLGSASHQVHLGSRSLGRGAMLSMGFGVLASIPLVARVLVPRLAAAIRKRASSLVSTPVTTQLRLERTDAEPSDGDAGIGFTVDEMTAMAERVLRDVGLTRGFARLVLLLGHGSTSLNNPHKSAYDCGACGGSVGGPNARAAARILNDARVRQALAERGITVPGDTVFVGGWHNTCKDLVTYFDLDLLPRTHQGEFNELRRIVETACDRNAHERCRRFHSAPLTLSPAAARRHVENRSEDLAQTRPELGHATNAVCFVGRRSRTRGMFLDRRTFLTSYDPTEDDAECTILTRTMQAVVPVCGGINLEYYFSYVDSAGWGCGTKLPHNLTSLVGVMDGMASDVRTGLPWQMVEIHEPVRLLIVMETTAENALRLMDRNEAIGRTVRNGWVKLAVLDPHTDLVYEFRNGKFQRYEADIEALPQASSSQDWYRGWREHLGFAQIGST